MQRFNNEDRTRALAMLECGRTEIHVARRLNVARSTITRLTRRVRETGTIADRPRSGAPCVTTVSQDNYIRQRHLHDRLLTVESTCSEVVGNHGVPVSRYTVRNGTLFDVTDHAVVSY